jgi:chitin synthase
MEIPPSDLFMENCTDRILCWELVSKRNSNWILHYVKSASAITDVPDGVCYYVRPSFKYSIAYILSSTAQVPELVAQRRRWLNGSFFAAIHSIVHFGYIYRSSYVVTTEIDPYVYTKWSCVDALDIPSGESFSCTLNCFTVCR